MPPDLIVLTASNGENLKLAERFVQAAAAQNASAELIDLTQLDLPLFTPRVKAAGPGPDLAGLHDQLHRAPRWVICAPEYNGSIPPSLTNAIARLPPQAVHIGARLGRHAGLLDWQVSWLRRGA